MWSKVLPGSTWAGEGAQQRRVLVCSYRGPNFGAQHPHVGLPPPATTVPGDPPMGASETSMGARHAHSAHTYIQAKHNHIK